MAKYIIHASPSRMWYVNKYLVPSMIKQKICSKNILIYNDTKKLGNLESFLDASKMLDESAWHLQDDVIISNNFRSLTDKYDSGIVCGFCSEPNIHYGTMAVSDMWYSFPCIRIPKDILLNFVKWVRSDYAQNRYRAYIEAGKFDDTLFREYLLAEHPNMKVYNLFPNIVDNVDYLIGGSLINAKRTEELHACYFRDKMLVKNLEWNIQNDIDK